VTHGGGLNLRGVFDWIEGSRTFDLSWGFATAALCLAIGIPILWWSLPQHRRSFFGATIDPQYRLQVAYGVFCLAMACTNFGCRAIPHDDLPLVHPTFFLITVAIVFGLGPRVVVMALARRRDNDVPAAA
jgi:hypothetical protein